MFSIFKKNSKINKLLLHQIRKRIHLDFDPAKDYYKILGVDSKSSEKQIKDEYYKLAKKHHPDLNNGVSSEYFKEMTAAYEILSDKEKRNKYDQLRSYSSQGFWNTSGNTKQSNNTYNKQYSDFNQNANNQQYSDFNNGNYSNANNYNKSNKKWQFTYVDPKTGQKSTFNFNADAFKNFDDFISKMRSEIKTDFSKSDSFKKQEEKSQRDFFGKEYYEKNKKYYQTHKKNDEFYADENMNKLNEEFNSYFFKRLRYFLIFGSIFMFFVFFSSITRRRHNEYFNNDYDSQMLPRNSYSLQNPNYDPYAAYPNQQAFRPIDYRVRDDPYNSNVTPRYR